MQLNSWPDLLALLGRRRRLFLILLALGIVASAVLQLMLKDKYEVRAILSPIASESESGSTLVNLPVLGMTGAGPRFEPSAAENVEFLQSDSFRVVLAGSKEFTDAFFAEPLAARKDTLEILARKITYQTAMEAPTLVLALRGKDPRRLYESAGILIRLANTTLRDANLARLKRDLESIERHAGTIASLDVRNRLLESSSEIHRLIAFAEARTEEFAFRVTGFPVLPEEPVGPRRVLLAGICLLLTLAGSALGVVADEARRGRSAA